MSSELNFKNKTVLITGGASGFGFELVKLFLSDGAKVIFTTREKTSAEKAIIEIPEMNQKNVMYYTIDLSNKAEIDKFLISIDKDFPSGIDVLVNNAASIIVGRFEKFSYDDLISTFNVNLVSSYMLSHHVIRKMKEKKNGVIINIISGVANIGLPFLSLYGIGKSSLRALSESISVELKEDNIDVIMVSPGAMNTAQEKKQKLIGMEKNPYEHLKKASPEIIARKVFQKIKKKETLIEFSLKTKLFELLQLISFNTAFNIKRKYTKKQHWTFIPESNLLAASLLRYLGINY